MARARGAPGAQVAGYAGLLLATPTVLYEVAAYVLPGLTRSERRLLAPIIFGSSILFYLGCDASAAAVLCWPASPGSHTLFGVQAWYAPHP